jgi:hypothetical protein
MDSRTIATSHTFCHINDGSVLLRFETNYPKLQMLKRMRYLGELGYTTLIDLLKLVKLVNFATSSENSL